MTPQEIRDAIAADPALQAMGTEHGAIAAALSVGRTRPNRKEIGFGTVLETIGLSAGNAVLDAIVNTADYRYVKPLLEQGRLIASSPLVAGALSALVAATVITQGQADALIALGQDPETISTQQVIVAMEGA